MTIWKVINVLKNKKDEAEKSERDWLVGTIVIYVRWSGRPCQQQDDKWAKAYRNDEMSPASVWERKFRHFSRALCHWLKGKTSKEALAMTVAFHVQYRAEGLACPLSWMTVSSPTLCTCNQLIWIQTTLFSTSSQFFDLDENSVKNVK